MKNNIPQLKKRIFNYTILFAVCCICFGYASNLYIKNQAQYTKIDSLQNSILNIQDQLNIKPEFQIPENIQIDTGFGSINIPEGRFKDDLNNFLSNISLLSGEFQQSQTMLTGYDWKYYFNLANIKLFQGYTILSSGENLGEIKDSIAMLGNSIQNYNNSSQLLGTGNDFQNDIINNRVLATGLRFLAQMKLCIYSFRELIANLMGVKDKIIEISNVFGQEIGYIEEWLKIINNKELSDCLKEYHEAVSLSYITMQSVGNLVDEYIDNSSQSLQDLVEQPTQCINAGEFYLSGSKSGIDDIVGSVMDRLSVHLIILQTLKQQDEEALKVLCESADQYSQSTNQASQKLSQGLSRLQDMFQQGEQQNREQQPGDSQQEEQSGQSQPMHTDIPQGLEKELMENIEIQGENWIREMQNIKGSGEYDPKNYLKQLFEQFFGEFENKWEGSGKGQDGNW